MRNIVLVIIFFCLYFNVNAQFKQGQNMLGGQISFYNTKSQYSNSTNNQSSNQTAFNTYFSFSKFNKPTSFNSFGINYGYSGMTGSSNSHSIGIFYGHTKLETLAKKFYLGLSGNGGVNYIFSKSYNSSGNISSKSDGINIYASGGIGLYYQLNNRFMLSAHLIDLISIHYNWMKVSALDASNNLTQTSKNKNISFSTGLTGFSLSNFSVGVRYLLK